MKRLMAIPILCIIGVAAVIAQDSSTKPTRPASSHPTSETTNDGETVNPLYASWSNWPIGTKLVYLASGNEGEHQYELQFTYTLSDSNEDCVWVTESVVWTKPADRESEPPRERAIPKHSDRCHIPSDPAAGEEDLTINGKIYKCKVIRREDKPDGRRTFKSAIWICDDLPGLIVKEEREITGGDDPAIRGKNIKILKSITKGSGTVESQPAASSAPASNPAK